MSRRIRRLRKFEPVRCLKQITGRIYADPIPAFFLGRVTGGIGRFKHAGRTVGARLPVRDSNAGLDGVGYPSGFDGKLRYILAN